MFPVIFAENPASDPTSVGTWMLVAMGLIGGGLGIAVAVKNLIAKPSDKESVPRKEFDELKAQVGTYGAQTNALTSRLLEYVTRKELDEMRQEFNKQYEKIEKYARARSHKLAAQVHSVQMGLEVLHRNLNAEMANLVSKMNEKLEKVQTSIVEMRTALDRRLPIKDNDNDN